MQTSTETRNLAFRLVASLIGLNCAFFTAYQISFNNIFYLREASFQADYKLLLITANLLTVIINLLPARRAQNSFKSYALFLISYMALMVFYQGYEYSRLFHLYFLTVLFVFANILKYANLTGLLEKYLLPNNLERKVLLIGENLDESIIQYIDKRQGHYKCVGILSDKKLRQTHSKIQYLGKISDIEEILYKDAIDEVIISTAILSVAKNR